MEKEQENFPLLTLYPLFTTNLFYNRDFFFFNQPGIFAIWKRKTDFKNMDYHEK